MDRKALRRAFAICHKGRSPNQNIQQFSRLNLWPSPCPFRKDADQNRRSKFSTFGINGSVQSIGTLKAMHWISERPIDDEVISNPFKY
jgi:hypothetical protein